MVELELVGLGKAFGGRVLFRDVGARVRSGECLAVTGPNGSGKSTLLRIVAALTRPTRGQAWLRVDSTPLAGPGLRAAVGLVSPALALYDELTARENLEFFARVRGLRLDQSHYLALLERVGLDPRNPARLRAFSSGMKQRLKYAFAIQAEPLLLLLDEPSANLDGAGVEMARAVMAEQRSRGVLVLATNDAQEAAAAEHQIRLGPA